ncbi:hypothetical protein AKJ16_DCAP11556 [Drosera capensis]
MTLPLSQEGMTTHVSLAGPIFRQTGTGIVDYLAAQCCAIYGSAVLIKMNDILEESSDQFPVATMFPVTIIASFPMGRKALKEETITFAQFHEQTKETISADVMDKPVKTKAKGAESKALNKVTRVDSVTTPPGAAVPVANLTAITSFFCCVRAFTVIEEVERLCRSFLWTGKAYGGNRALVAWEDVCVSKEAGFSKSSQLVQIICAAAALGMFQFIRSVEMLQFAVIGLEA